MAKLSIIFLFIFIIVALIIEFNKSKNDYFTPVKIFLFFSFLANISTVFYVFDKSYLENRVFSAIDNQFRVPSNVELVVFIYLLAFMVSVFFVFLGYYGRYPKASKLISKVSLFDRDVKEHIALAYGFVFIFLGFLVYFYFISSIGGLFSLWSSLYLRTEITAGTGYISTVYKSLIIFGFLLVYRPVFRRSKLFLFFLAFLIGCVLVSLGQRGPLASFVFSMIVYHNYRVDRIKNIFSVRVFLLFGLLLFFATVAVSFRSSDFFDTFKKNPAIVLDGFADSILERVVFRFGRLERDLVVVEYFSKNELWMGASYISLLTAPIPRGLYADKPPLDTGVYLFNIAGGYDVSPPKPIKDMKRTSWPDGNWAGYMNFGLIGFLILSASAAWIYGFFGNLVRSNNRKFFVVAFYSASAWGGGVVLSPYGIFSILSVYLPFFCLSLFCIISLRNTDKLKRVQRSAASKNV
jgi:MFS family permease